MPYLLFTSFETSHQRTAGSNWLRWHDNADLLLAFYSPWFPAPLSLSLSQLSFNAMLPPQELVPVSINETKTSTPSPVLMKTTAVTSMCNFNNLHSHQVLRSARESLSYCFPPHHQVIQGKCCNHSYDSITDPMFKITTTDVYRDTQDVVNGHGRTCWLTVFVKIDFFVS